MAHKYKSYPEYKDSGVEWLGEVPEHWEVSRIKYNATLNPSKSEVSHLSYDTNVSFLPMEAIGENGDLDTSRTKRISEVLSGYTYIAEGDVCIAKITPCFENGKGAIMHDLTNFIGFATTEIIPLRCELNTNSSFLYYLLTSSPFKDIAEGSMYGAGGQKRVADSFVANYHFTIPSLTEQKQIAGFLDHETGKIDRLIEKQEELIALLKEKRQAVISHAVTKGLNPNAPLKPSGVEWLGDVPEHWEVKKFRYIFTLGRGLTITKSNLQDSGIPCLNYGEIHSKYGFEVDPDRHPLKYVSEKYLKDSSASLLNQGDCVFADTSEDFEGAGNFSQLISEHTLFAGYHTIIARPEKANDSRFLAYFLDSSHYRIQIKMAVKGVKVFSVTQAILRSTNLLLPPLTEQKQIATYLDHETDKVDRLIEKQEEMTQLLHERRTALISAAVTGKIDVRDWKAPSTNDL